MNANVGYARSIKPGLSAATVTTRLLVATAFLVAASHESAFAQAATQISPSQSQASATSTTSDQKPPAKDETVDEGKAVVTDGRADPRSKLLADTHLLLTLSRELQAEAAKTTPDTFSLRMVKKAEEIQKLAAVVRAEMTKR